MGTTTGSESPGALLGGAGNPPLLGGGTTGARALVAVYVSAHWGSQGQLWHFRLVDCPRALEGIGSVTLGCDRA